MSVIFSATFSPSYVKSLSSTNAIANCCTSSLVNIDLISTPSFLFSMFLVSSKSNLGICFLKRHCPALSQLILFFFLHSILCSCRKQCKHNFLILALIWLSALLVLFQPQLILELLILFLTIVYHMLLTDLS